MLGDGENENSTIKMYNNSVLSINQSIYYYYFHDIQMLTSTRYTTLVARITGSFSIEVCSDKVMLLLYNYYNLN